MTTIYKRVLQMQVVLSCILLSNLIFCAQSTSSTDDSSETTNAATNDDARTCNEGNEQQCPSRDDDTTEDGNNENINNSNNNNQTAWKWNVDADHRCNIRKINIKDLATINEFRHGIPPLYHEPLVLYYNLDDDDDDDNESNGHVHVQSDRPSSNNNKNNKSESKCIRSKFIQMTSIQNITTQTFNPNFEITLSSSNSFSDHRQITTLSTYINDISSSTYEIQPHVLSNRTWYLFGETYSNEWKNILLDYYCLPPCQTCTNDLSALSFGIGGKGSGVQWHVHGPGFSESIHGKKHWVLYPPNQKPNYDPDFTSRHWMEEVYTTLPKDDVALPYECTLGPREMIYFPDGWYHATINLSPYTAFISTFTTEHGFKRKL